ncbi:ribbon-helix-helix domain-containing protein [Xanthobacteraceae bacterium Astr-EGSB]|uniref:ribbon-helix-helix domain-containing protein n=1 Tax=Astrobacterium formosum TaxID=3069710 RepID=UPI0027B3A165|nr:ribbon-helix-helix domain-containing protein [Xanthobacteraceae bacterium Astr-EGSB]
MLHRITKPMATRSIVVNGRAQTLIMEDAYWRGLEQVAKENELTLAEILEIVDAALGNGDELSSALRAFFTRGPCDDEVVTNMLAKQGKR